jgi:hypothetical protein
VGLPEAPKLALAGCPSRICSFGRDLGREQFLTLLWIVMILCCAHVVRIWVNASAFGYQEECGRGKGQERYLPKTGAGIETERMKRA